MLDTHCRRYVQPIIGIGANFFFKAWIYSQWSNYFSYAYRS